MHSLPLFHRIAGQTVIVLGGGEAGAAKARLVERAGGLVTSHEQADARLAFVALPEPEAVAARLKDRGVLVNVADRLDLCDFTLPSVLDRDPVLIAVSTGGASAGLAKALRLRLETLLPASLGDLARGLEQARGAMRQRWPSPRERRSALDSALEEGGTLDPLETTSAQWVDTWLAEGASGSSEVFAFALSSDDPDDLTLRQARLLGKADFVIHDATIPAAILNRARADAVRQDLAAGLPEPENGVVVVIRRG